MLIELLILLFALLGIIFGLALTYIAPEELKDGKKYFVLLKRILFAAISLTAIFYFFRDRQVCFLFFFVILAISLFAADFKIRSRRCYGLHYLLFILIYFLNADPFFRIILATLIFLYGFPAGMLLRSNNTTKNI